MKHIDDRGWRICGPKGGPRGGGIWAVGGKIWVTGGTRDN